MPRRRRREKRNASDLDMVEAWATVFESSYDFGGDLVPFGFPTDEAARKGAAAAWRRYGAAFLVAREPNPELPWALEKFGRPPGC